MQKVDSYESFQKKLKCITKDKPYIDIKYKEETFVKYTPPLEPKGQGKKVATFMYSERS